MLRLTMLALMAYLVVTTQQQQIIQSDDPLLQPMDISGMVVLNAEIDEAVEVEEAPAIVPIQVIPIQQKRPSPVGMVQPNLGGVVFEQGANYGYGGIPVRHPVGDADYLNKLYEREQAEADNGDVLIEDQDDDEDDQIVIENDVNADEYDDKDDSNQLGPIELEHNVAGWSNRQAVVDPVTPEPSAEHLNETETVAIDGPGAPEDANDRKSSDTKSKPRSTLEIISEAISTLAILIIVVMIIWYMNKRRQPQQIFITMTVPPGTPIVDAENPPMVDTSPVA